MKAYGLISSILCALLVGMCGPGASPAHALETVGTAEDDGFIIIDTGADEESESCCGYLGVNLDDLTARLRDKLSYPHKKGVLISRVEPGSPAEKAGLEANDIAYSFEGTVLKDAAHLVSLVRERHAGDKVSIVIFRDGKEKKITAVLDKRKPMQLIKDEFGKYSDEIAKAISSANWPAMRAYRMAAISRGGLGMTFEDLNDDLAPYFGAKKDDGVLVLDVEAESDAEQAGIKSGDVITSVNGVAVASTDDVSEELWELEEGDSVTVEVLRKGVRKSFVIEVEEDSGLHRLFISPFERSKAPVESFEWRMRDKDEAAKLKEEMKDLKERLKDLEDRLEKAERRQ